MTAQLSHDTKAFAKTLQPTKLFILSHTEKLHMLTRKYVGPGTTKEEPRKGLSLRVIRLLTYHPIYQLLTK